MSSSIWFFSLVFFAAAEKSKSRNWTTAFVLFNGRHICAALGSAFLFGLNFLDFSFCLRGRFFFRRRRRRRFEIIGTWLFFCSLFSPVGPRVEENVTRIVGAPS